MSNLFYKYLIVHGLEVVVVVLKESEANQTECELSND
jgi:hypothetical protein